MKYWLERLKWTGEDPTERIVAAIMSDLAGRSGILDGADEETANDIALDLLAITQREY